MQRLPNKVDAYEDDDDAEDVAHRDRIVQENNGIDEIGDNADGDDGGDGRTRIEKAVIHRGNPKYIAENKHKKRQRFEERQHGAADGGVITPRELPKHRDTYI